MKKTTRCLFRTIGWLLSILLLLSIVSIPSVRMFAYEEEEDEINNAFNIADWTIRRNYDNSYILVEYKGNDKNIRIPKNSPQYGTLAVDNSTDYGMIEHLSFEEGFSFPSSCYKLFSDTFLRSIDLSGVDTSAVTKMDYMFYHSYDLVKIDFGSIDTRKVTNMQCMFEGCTGLTRLDLSCFNTSRVDNMDSLFQDCVNLKSIDLSSFDTQRCTNMLDMFNNCKNLTEIDLSNFDMGLADWLTPFDGCEKLQAIDIPLNYSVTSSSFDRLPGYGYSFMNLNGERFDHLPWKESKSFRIYRIADTNWKWDRLAGANRFKTMASITDTGFNGDFDESLKTLIVATGESFPDALSGAALAGVYKCPILLTKTNSLPAETKNEIQRLASTNGCKVIILGGTTAVSEKVEKDIQSIGGYITTERIAGKNREKTAISVYNKGANETNGFAVNDTIILTTGYNFADALSISPYAYATKTPILLAKKDGSLSDDIKNLLANNSIKKVIILGGKNAVSTKTEDYLNNSLGKTVLRLSGVTRYNTSGEIVSWELGLKENAAFQPAREMSIAGMGVASGDNFPDALASVSLLGHSKAVLLLVDNTKNRSVIEKNINKLIKPYGRLMGKGYILGGTMAVSKELEGLLNKAVYFVVEEDE